MKYFSMLLSCVLMLSSCATVPTIPHVDDSTVLIKSKIRLPDSKKDGWGVCSGVYIGKNVILTAAHCFPSEDGIVVKQIFVKKLGKSALATVIKRDRKVDLALIRTPLAGTPVILAPYKLHKGVPCFAIGNPLGIESVLTQGMISKLDLNYAKSKMDYLLFSAIVLPGNSGGGLFDQNGYLLGIIVMSTSLMGPMGASGLGIAVSLKDIKEFLK